MEKDFHRTFTKCPCCGGENRFFEQMADEMKERGLARPEWHFRYDMRDGIVVDPQKVASIPIGSEVPQYGFATDICIDCGCIYAIDIVRTNSKKPAPLAVPPNRAQRRRDSREGELPFSTS